MHVCISEKKKTHKIFKNVIRSADSNYPLLEKSDHKQKISICIAKVWMSH